MYYGNYTLQDLILASRRLRDAVKAQQGVGLLSKEEADAARGVDASGSDYLGMPFLSPSDINGCNLSIDILVQFRLRAMTKHCITFFSQFTQACHSGTLWKRMANLLCT